MLISHHFPLALAPNITATEIDSNKRTAPLFSRLEFSIPKIINALVNHDNFSGVTHYPKTEKIQKKKKIDFDFEPQFERIFCIKN